MRRLKTFLVRFCPRFITREKLIRTLDKNFGEAGIQITVRRYNQILTDLGFDLEEW